MLLLLDLHRLFLTLQITHYIITTLRRVSGFTDGWARNLVFRRHPRFINEEYSRKPDFWGIECDRKRWRFEFLVWNSWFFHILCCGGFPDTERLETVILQFVIKNSPRCWLMTESIQDTSPRIHPSRNKKPVSDETCSPNLSVGSMLQSKI